MFLFKILWIIEINYQTVLSFLIGLLMGFVLLLLIYGIIVLKSLRNVKYTKVDPTDTLTEAEAKEMIAQALVDFKDKTKRGKKSKGNHFKDLSYDLVYGIASRFFPKSKYPLAEISISEAIELLGYIQVRIDEILDRKGVRLLKRFKISTIIDISRNTKKIVDNKAFKVTKKLSKTTGWITKTLSIINPLNLFRKLVVETTLTKVTDRLYLIALSIVGEEAFKIYSKAVLKKEVSIDTDVESLIDDVEKDFEDAKREAKSSVYDDKDIDEEKPNVKARFRSKPVKLNEIKIDRNIKFDPEIKFLEHKKVEE